MFKGPQKAEDRDMIVHKLRHPIEANSIRIRPWEFEELICVRFELYGCDIPGSPGTTDVLPVTELNRFNRLVKYPRSRYLSACDAGYLRGEVRLNFYHPLPSGVKYSL